jgi:predicted GIY-YIG superfamily endonuclease
MSFGDDYADIVRQQKLRRILSTHYVYRMFDQHDRLLYIGRTYQPTQRLIGHKSATPWFADVVRIEWRCYPDFRAAELAEKLAIRREKPIHNKVHCRPYRNPRVMVK